VVECRRKNGQDGKATGQVASSVSAERKKECLALLVKCVVCVMFWSLHAYSYDSEVHWKNAP
jgi:hypothetical protein